MGLYEVTTTAQALREAETARAAAMQTALAEGVSIVDIAKAAGVTRQTVYRITRSETHPGRSDVEVLDAGLGALLELGLPTTVASEVTKALMHSDPLVKARRVRLAIANLPPGARVREVAEIGDALLVTGRLLAGPGRS